ncbi:MAG TPA: YdbH domain-containing protein [Geminicoccaceae bacterium]|nr:YdbH domain-containing protein [Geminicoccaceae bacterium]
MRALGAILLIVVLLVGAVAAALLWLPGPLVRAGLRAAGVEAVVFDDLRLRPSILELSGLQIGAPPDHRLARLQIRYRLTDLLRGWVESVEIDGLQLRGRITDGRLELAGLGAPGEPGEQSSLGLMPWPRKVVLRAAALELATPWGELRLPLALELQPTAAAAEFQIEVTAGRLINDAGILRADLTLQGQAPLGQGLDLAGIVASGEAAIAAESFAVPELAEGIDGHSEVTFELAGGRLEARIGPALIGVELLAPRLAALAGPLPPPWQIALGDDTAPLRVSGAPAGETLALEVDGALSLAATGDARLGAELAARLGFRDGGRLAEVAGRASATFEQLRWREALLERGRLELQGEGTPTDGRGMLDLELAGSGQPTPELGLRGAALRHKLTAAFADRRLTLAAREAGALTIDRAEWRGLGNAGPMTWRLEAGTEPLLAVSFAANGGIVWEQDLAARSEALELTVDAVAPPLQARAEVAGLTLSLSGDQSGLRTGRVGVAGGQLSLPDTQISLAGIATEVVLAADGLAPNQTIPLTIASVSHDGAPGWFAPLAVSGTVRPGAAAIVFDARLSRSQDGLTLTARGRHELAAGRGRAEVKLAPLVFAEGQRQPGRLAPVLGNLLADVTGTVALDGTLGWGSGKGVDADLALLVDDLAFTTGPTRFSKINGVVAIDRLWPLTTPPGQQLAIGLLDLGLPLTGGLIAFQLLPEPALAVERLRWDFAGGTVSAAPFRVGSATSDIMATLSADRLDLAQLFALTRLDGLSGEGTIRGTLPIRVTGVEAVIVGGELKSDGPGWLRYRPDAAPAALQAGGENVSLLLQALENFRYEALRITLDGRTDAEMDIGLHVQGANPELYDGYPIEFNLDLEGELANILRSGLATYQIPERIREQMQGFRR